MRQALPHFILKRLEGTSLVVQWLRTCLPMQGTWVPSLIQEDSTCSAGQRSPCTTPQTRSHRNEKPPTREWPLLTLTRESPWAAMMTQSSQK